MYRTGDRVRTDESGRLWFVGRRDNQIKHMGYRIELDEIEAALNALPYVTQGAVVYHRVREQHGRILAFVVRTRSRPKHPPSRRSATTCADTCRTT